jgi:hypothetical protein
MMNELTYWKRMEFDWADSIYYSGEVDQDALDAYLTLVNEATYDDFLMSELPERPTYEQ